MARWNPIMTKASGGLGVSSVYNHLIMTIDYHKDSSNDIRIVGFDVEYKSVDWPADKPCLTSIDTLGEAYYQEGKNISFTYEVYWKKVDTVWAHRFDHYIKLGNDNVHHLQFISSVVIAFIFTFFVFRIL